MTGKELKKRRNNLELSQEQLARELDVSVFTVARWEQLKDKEISQSGMLDLALKQLEKEGGK
jgi:DNA-binding transcriptional regulator YiaG